MAAGHTSIAQELLSCVSRYNYRVRVTSLSEKDTVTIKYFKNSRLGKFFNVDRTKCVSKGTVYADHLFDIFGEYSEESAYEVRKSVIWTIKQNPTFYDRVGEIVLRMQNRTLNMWISAVSNRNNYGDELMLYALCKQWHRHAMVICRNRNWSTIEPNGPMSEDQLIEICDLRFLYVKPGVFAELRLKSAHKNRKLAPSSWSDYMYVTPSEQTSSTVVRRVPELENFIESIHWTPEGITIQTAANPSTSTPHETIVLDGEAETISLVDTEDDNSDLLDNVETTDYAEPNEDYNVTDDPHVSYDYTSDILKDSESEDYRTIVGSTNSTSDTDAANNITMAIRIKSEPSDFTDLSNSGFMSDGGYSTLSQYQTPSKLKTLSLRILRGEDKWPTPSLKWICCIAVSKLDGNYLHLCWISAKKCRKKLRSISDNPTTSPVPDIKNGNETGNQTRPDPDPSLDNSVTPK